MTTSPPTPSLPAPGLRPWTLFSRLSVGGAGESAPPDLEDELVPPDLSGTVLRGRYELVRRIGCGGMGEVYEARFLASGQAVAVKILFRRYAAREEFLVRFRRELQVLEAIRHPNVVRVRDFDQASDGRPFMVMELIDGIDLASRVARRGPLPITEVIELGRQLCDALACLHARGVIHRDITPRNVLVEGEGPGLKVKLIDLGVCKATAEWYAEARPYMTPPGRRLRTRTGMILGTPGYTAPEAIDHPPAPHHDIYSLGVVLFEAATGRRLPRVWAHAIPDRVDASALGLDRHAWRTLLKAIEPCPEVRYVSAAAMAEALEDLRLVVADSAESVPVEGGSASARELSGQESRSRAPVWVKLVLAFLVVHALVDLAQRLRVRDDVERARRLGVREPASAPAAEVRSDDVGWP
ncbi:MAG: serine/threonine protein kinase [Myxococcales bacterium]|nr:serine/threonine protein kinase [Myxococcales bacterium]